MKVMTERHLYKITTKGLREFYVVARSWQDAASTLTDALDKTEWGYSGDRKVESITHISSEGFTDNRKQKRRIGDAYRLIIQEDDAL